MTDAERELIEAALEYWFASDAIPDEGLNRGGLAARKVRAERAPKLTIRDTSKDVTLVWPSIFKDGDRFVVKQTADGVWEFRPLP